MRTEHRDPGVGASVVIVDTTVWVDSLRNPETEWLDRQADQLDCFIAPFCLANAHALLHRDHYFDAFEQNLGLAVLHPS